MFSFRRLPIKRKLKLVIMSTTLFSVLLVVAGFGIYEMKTFTQLLTNDLSTKADIIAQNTTAALAFTNREDAEQTLSALRSQPGIRVAAVYTKDGELFAQYTVAESTSPPAHPGLDGPQFGENSLWVFRPIILNESRVGTIYLESDLETMNQRIRSYGTIAALVLAGSLLIAFFLASRLERGISRPILELAQSARIVSEQQEYSVRVENVAGDEVGVLGKAFNDMLTQIQERDLSLQKTNEAMALEIAERKKAETEISKLNADLEQRVLDRTTLLEAANKELEAFSYSVSHDLRSPLRHIDGFVTLLRSKNESNLDESGKRYLKIISDAAKRMGSLIDDLLVFSKMGRAEMAKGRVNVEQLVHDVFKELESEVGTRQIEWTVDRLPEILGDPAMLKLVWTNLVSNALKYSGTREETRIHIGCEENGRETIFFVKDNGVGFDMQYANKLFGVFQRLHRQEDFEGTGIGLANVRRIIYRHGGRTWAEGELDKGATFFFSLPKPGERQQS